MGKIRGAGVILAPQLFLSTTYVMCQLCAKPLACAKDVQNTEGRETSMKSGFNGIDFHRRL
jgi:hypothetical protein